MVDQVKAYNQSIAGMCSAIAQGKPANEAFDKARDEYREAVAPDVSASHAALCSELALARDDLKRLSDCIADCVYENSSGKLHASMALSKISKEARGIKL